MNSFSLYKRMFQYVSAYWTFLGLSILLSICVVLFETLSLWFGASLVQTLFIPNHETLVKPEFTIANANAILKYYTSLIIIRKNPLESLQIVCLLMSITFIAKNLFIYIKSLVMAKLNLWIISDMRNQLYGHVLTLPTTYFDKNRSGDIISRIVNDVSGINQSLTGTFDKLFTEPLRVIFFICMLFIINLKLTLVVFIVFPIIGLMITRIGKVVRRRSKRVYEYMAGMLAILHETVSGIRTVKMFNTHLQEGKKFFQENARFTKGSFRSTLFSAVSSPLTEVFGVVCVIILLWYGGRETLNGTGFKAEDFVRFLLFLFTTFTPLKTLSNINNTLQNGFAAAERVFKVLDTPTEKFEDSPQEISFKNEIVYKDITFNYPECQDDVLKNVSFSLRKGQVVALVGSSGSGKSTILDLLPRFYDVTRGSILIDGNDIKDLPLMSLRKLFGIVSQETFLFNDTISNNIAYGSDNVSKEQIETAAKAANAFEFIEKMPNGFDTIIGERGVMLSGGQRQRLSIARALLRNPPILILDEATSALDTESERLVQAAINNVIENRTTLVVAHRLSTICHADLILVLENGEIIEQGTHEELLSIGKRYKYLYDIQFSATSI